MKIQVYAYGKDLEKEGANITAEKWCLEFYLFEGKFRIWIRSFSDWRVWKRLFNIHIGMGHIAFVITTEHSLPFPFKDFTWEKP